ncbi:MAG: type II toxin-antitoxin system VapC family toxin [Caulobacter sp.]|nr:type II toxin-antitoxin system VapC family toxin [Caulobacter sp.]
MIVYLDTSVLAPLFSNDALSDRADRYFSGALPAVFLSDFAAAEFASAVARKARTGALLAEEARATFAAFDAWASTEATRVQVSPADISVAERFIRRLDLTLRAPDAIHIAMAIRLDATLATFDKAMEASARTLGCAVADA